MNLDGLLCTEGGVKGAKHMANRMNEAVGLGGVADDGLGFVEGFDKQDGASSVG